MYHCMQIRKCASHLVVDQTHYGSTASEHNITCTLNKIRVRLQSLRACPFEGRKLWSKVNSEARSRGIVCEQGLGDHA